MSSDTDHPRQRTVAELLAQHGDSGATGRRRRRREADPSDEGGAAPDSGSAATHGSTPDQPAATPRQAAPAPDRAVLRAPVPWDSAPPGPAPGPAPQPVEREQREREQWSPPGRPQQAPYGQAPYEQPPFGQPPFEQHPAEQSPWEPSARQPARRESAPPPERPVPREYGPRGYRPAPQQYSPDPLAEPNRSVLAPLARPAAERSDTGAVSLHPPARGNRSAPARRTEHIPRVRGDQRSGALDPGLTGPIDHQRPPGAPPFGAGAFGSAPPAPASAPPDDPDAGPSTMVGVAPVGAEDWHRTRTAPRKGAADGGPPTEASSPLDFDAPAGLGRSPVRRAAGGPDLDEEDEETPPRRRLGRSARSASVSSAAAPSSTERSSAGQAWMAVVAQWIIGAVGGAALWVGFRFLWRELPIVALAAAVLVTVGLVLVVRALLRNSDLRTTIFAVLVGLLLTVSPAILVLLGR